MINNVRFSSLAVGDRFSFRNFFIGRRWIKTGEYSFIPDTQQESEQRRQRLEELITKDTKVTKLRLPQDSETAYTVGHGGRNGAGRF